MSFVLSPHPNRTAPQGPVICVVMDGVGLGPGDAGDAVALARTPNLDRLRQLRSYRSLKAHGTAVGMPSDADMGNSEVGHNALGSGRIFDQGAKLVAEAIASGQVFEAELWKTLVGRVANTGEPLHFIGLLSDGNVHSHVDHLFAMIRKAAEDGVARVRVHALLDGRDVPARSALQYVDRLEAVLAQCRAGGRDYRVASGGGRMKLTMDRYEADWEMVARGWQVHVHGEGEPFASLRAAVEARYAQGDKGDQDLDGFVIAENGVPVGPIRDGAAVVLFNFRGDRAIEISKAFELEEFSGFDRGERPDVVFAGMMQYDGDERIPERFLVSPPTIDRTMGAMLAATGRRQLAISETQKFGHVTYFWNGNRSGKFAPELETYIEIPSERLPFDERPWMKAAEVTDALLAAVHEQPYDFVRVNYANGDMVGHTGVLEAAIVAVEAVDLCLGRLLRAAEQLGAVVVVTADHGNADQMFDMQRDGTRRPKTSHTLSPVPFAIYDPSAEGEAPALRELGPDEPAGLANVAATCLELLGFAAPPDYAPSLLRRPR